MADRPQPKAWEDILHVLINELAPNFINGLLDHLPSGMYEKLIQSSDWVQKLEPIVSALILRVSKHAPWADSLTVTGLARLREEVGKRAKGEHTATKEKKEKVVVGNSIRALLLVADKTNVDILTERMLTLSEKKRNQLLNMLVPKDKDNVITNLAACDEALFPSFVDLLIMEEAEPVAQPSFIEEVIACQNFVAYFSSLPKEKKISIKRHIEHIPEGRRRERLQALNSGTPEEFLTYVDTVLLAKEYYDFDKLLPSFTQEIKIFFGEAHEKRSRQGGFLAGFLGEWRK